MLNLNPTISKIEELVKEDTEASITYAALECRLAIAQPFNKNCHVVSDIHDFDVAAIRHQVRADIFQRIVYSRNEVSFFLWQHFLLF